MNIAIDGQLIVESHFSICYSTDDLDKLEKLQSLIDSKLFVKGIITSQNARNQLELFRTCLLGNATELKRL